MKRLVLFCILFVSLLSAVEIETIYGKVEFDEPVLVDIYNSDAMNRLRHIDQSGTVGHLKISPAFTRYEHSIGVFQLLRRFGAPIREQIAGMLHDASHTVFSHVGDFVFDHKDGDLSYQDSIHAWYLKKAQLGPILQKHNLSIEDVIHNQKMFTMLEQKLPDLCADRLEYNLLTGYYYNLITKKEIEELLCDLRFEDGRWYFLNPSFAKRLAKLSLHFTENFWGADWNAVVYHWTSQAIKRGIEIGLFSDEDILFSIDEKILIALRESKDPVIKKYWTMCEDHEEHYSSGSQEDFDFYISPKFRGIDPWVKQGEGFKRLSEIDAEFAGDFDRVEQKMILGYFIKFKEQDIARVESSSIAQVLETPSGG